jgi:hypothetical protein
MGEGLPRIRSGYLVVPRLPALASAVIHDDQARQRIGPPPVEQRGEHEADEHGTSQVRIDQGDMRFSCQAGIAYGHAWPLVPVDPSRRSYFRSVSAVSSSFPTTNRIAD